MMSQSEEPITPVSKDDPSVPWTVADTWLGVFLFIFLTAGILIVVQVWQEKNFLQTIGLVVTELLYLVPAFYILAKRHIPLRALGFRSFNGTYLALGCGLLVMAYLLIMVHNLILAFLGILTQGEMIYNLFGSLDDPVWLVFVGVFLAPFVEEMFFRGFLFAGFRQRFGWNRSALLSAALFSLAHLQPVALIPTFILGYLLAYLFHKSNSLWPGIILHFLVNSMGFCLIFAMSQSHF